MAAPEDGGKDAALPALIAPRASERAPRPKGSGKERTRTRTGRRKAGRGHCNLCERTHDTRRRRRRRQCRSTSFCHRQETDRAVVDLSVGKQTFDTSKHTFHARIFMIFLPTPFNLCCLTHNYAPHARCRIKPNRIIYVECCHSHLAGISDGFLRPPHSHLSQHADYYSMKRNVTVDINNTPSLTSQSAQQRYSGSHTDSKCGSPSPNHPPTGHAVPILHLHSSVNEAHQRDATRGPSLVPSLRPHFGSLPLSLSLSFCLGPKSIKILITSAARRTGPNLTRDLLCVRCRRR